ncbi:MAG TPA: tripartite tricarboxylate transporter substrate binding protein, partial [Burkholderiales bacterium]|nr:tripartite tricarboxylate transporter substrate binding protein [Burkholderiales bacterium]
MKKLLQALLLGLCTVVAGAAWSQGYPNKPVKIVVPFPPGGATDTMGRNLANELTKSTGQSFIVENKGGANGIIGTDFVAKAAPDGYTLLLSGVGTNAINHSLYKDVTYDSLKDFVNITLIATGPNVLVVHPSFEAKTLQDLIKMAKAQPGKLSYGSNGNGTSGHLAMEMLKQAAGLDMQHIPYKGGGPAMTDLIGGQIPMLFTNQDTALQNVRAGKIRAVAVASLQRNPAFPDVPTVAESGVPGFSAVSWFGLSAPAGTPKDVLAKLQTETLKALKSADFKSKLESVGFVVVGNSPQEFNGFIQTEIDKWGKVVKAS